MEFNTGDIVRHFKGNLYLIIGYAEHTETGEPLVIYKALYGDGVIYARPTKMLEERVPENKFNPTNQVFRFEPYKPSSKVKED